MSSERNSVQGSAPLLLLLLLLATCLACPAGAAEGPATAPRSPATAATTPPAPQAAALVERLKADEYAVRAKARAELAPMGEDARAALEAAVRADADPNQVGEARALLAGLDNARQYGPTRVTLHVRDLPAPEALAALASQATVTFAPPGETLWPGNGGAAPPRVTLDVDKQPFWSAVQQLCRQAGVRVAWSAPGGPVQLAVLDPKEPPAPHAVAGPFLFKVTRIERTRGLSFDDPRNLNGSTGLRVGLSCSPEPKVASAGATWSCPQLEELVAEDGHALDPKPFWGGPAGVGGMGGMAVMGRMGGGQVGAGMTQTTILYRADVPGGRIARMRLTARIMLPGNTQTFAVDNPLNAGRVERRIGGYVFVLKDVGRTAEGRYTFTVEAGAGDHSPGEFAALVQSLQRQGPQLSDAQGQALRPQTASARSSSGTYTATHQLIDALGNGQKAGPPARFTWEVPVDPRTLTLPIEFTDLPLP